ncbi:hypothetical protein DXG03_008537 [Asterophora parasitica]|uniref:Uncharacterized protein n=1 Tax=Asterophora parasitica TaxID=117018 RepID=A0A9P7GCC8_9AGAR|nr:hypothetical protein DXG03_008537 [Asterophora parasitica]
MSQHLQHLHDSARSSTTTIADTSGAAPHGFKPTQSPLERELTRDELRIEKYGGSDIRDPPEQRTDGAPEPEPEQDEKANQVSWDGPNDMSNPQNWSTRRKWFITFGCALMTVNV